MRYISYVYLAIILLSIGCITAEERQQKQKHLLLEHEIKVSSDNLECMLWWDREGMKLHYRDKDLHRLYVEIGERACLLKYPIKVEATPNKDPDWIPNDGDEDLE